MIAVSKDLSTQSILCMKAAQEYAKRHQGGIIWHTQGSGKSLIMVWFAKWIRENITDARVLLLTDRTELTSRLKSLFGVDENPPHQKLKVLAELNTKEKWLLCHWCINSKG